MSTQHFSVAIGDDRARYRFVGLDSNDGSTTGVLRQGELDFLAAELAKVGAEAPTRYDDADGVPFDDLAKLMTGISVTIAHKAGRQVALTLSDSFCVDRYRAEFLELMRNGTVDLVFANEEENRLEDVRTLEAAGIVVDVSFPRTVAEVPAAIRAWGRRLEANAEAEPIADASFDDENADAAQHRDDTSSSDSSEVELESSGDQQPE